MAKADLLLLELNSLSDTILLDNDVSQLQLLLELNSLSDTIRLLLNNSVKGAIQRIRDDMTADTEDRRDRWINELEQLGSLADKDADRLRAIEQLFKAEGWQAPDKSEVVQYSGSFLADLSDLDLTGDEVGEIQGEIPLDNSDLH